MIEALTPLDRMLRVKMYKNNARSRLFCRIAKSSIYVTDIGHTVLTLLSNIVEAAAERVCFCSFSLPYSPVKKMKASLV